MVPKPRGTSLGVQGRIPLLLLDVCHGFIQSAWGVDFYYFIPAEEPQSKFNSFLPYKGNMGTIFCFLGGS